MILFLNDIGTWEVLLILVFILIFFGSKSIPGLARTMGRTIRQIKDASNDLQSEIRKSGEEMKKDLNLKGIIEDTANDIRRPLDQHAQDLESALKYQPKTSIPKMSQKEVQQTKEAEEAKKIAEKSSDTKDTSSTTEDSSEEA